MEKVAHDTEVPSLAIGVEIVDVAGIDTRIFILPREVSTTTGWLSREVSRSHSSQSDMSRHLRGKGEVLTSWRRAEH